MAKQIKRTMTDTQFVAAIEELNSRLSRIRMRGGRAGRIFQDKTRYSRKDRQQGKRIESTAY